MKQEIIDLIERNRISSVEVSDALGKMGVIDGLLPINNLKFAVGEVFYVATYNESNYPLHEQIENIPEGKVAFIDAIDCENRAVLGDLVSKYLVLYKRTKGVVVSGFVRDVHRLKKEGYPIWAKGVTPLGCFNEKPQISEIIFQKIDENKNKFAGAIAVCDDSGVVIIEKKMQTKELIESLKRVELQEDLWYFCVDTLKKSTFETICKKIYKNEEVLLTNELREKIKNV